MNSYEILKRVHLAGPARALNLLRRVPAVFAGRGWRADEDRLAIATAAISCTALKAEATLFRIPAAALLDPEWAFARERGRASAGAIVRELRLGELLSPE